MPDSGENNRSQDDKKNENRTIQSLCLFRLLRAGFPGPAFGPHGFATGIVAGTPRPVGPGEHLFIPRGVVHRFDNGSGATATCLSVLTPGVLGPEYFREVAALAAAGPPDASKLREIMLRYGLVPA